MKLHYNVFYISWNKKTVLKENEYDNLYPSGSAAARIYGTPKMQKFSYSDSFPKLRPIVSFIGTFNSNLTRFPWNLLSSLVPDDYSCEDTFSFDFWIKNANLSGNFLISYDVTSLSTNILLQETTDIAINLIFNHNLHLQLKNVSFLLHDRLIFLFNNNLYNNPDGVAMGFSFASVIANILMAFYWSELINEHNVNKPKLYLRYVDDILAAFGKELDS